MNFIKNILYKVLECPEGLFSEEDISYATLLIADLSLKNFSVINNNIQFVI